jgi:hypothetical protein
MPEPINLPRFERHVWTNPIHPTPFDYTDFQVQLPIYQKWQWQHTQFSGDGYGGSGTFSGIVRVQGVPIGGRAVRLYDRISGELAFQTVSASDGSYTFPAVRDGRRYYLVCLDAQPGGYNAGIIDYADPV